MNASVPLPITLRKRAQFELGMVVVFSIIIALYYYYEGRLPSASGFLVLFIILSVRSLMLLRHPFIELADEALFFVEDNRRKKVKIKNIERISVNQTTALWPKRQVSRFVIRLINDQGVHVIATESERTRNAISTFFAEHLGSKWQAEFEFVKSLRPYST